MANQLIILGNGFDLACGLKSSYNDFFEWELGRENITPNFMKINLEMIKKDQSSFYNVDPKLLEFNIRLLLFFMSEHSKNSTWQNIESQMDFYLQNGILKSNYYFVDNEDDKIKKYRFQILKNANKIVNERGKYKKISEGEYNQQLTNIFLDDLYDLEEDFETFLFEKAGYYSNSKEGQNTYFKLSRELLMKLAKVDAPQDNFSYNVISFNYTDPWNKRWSENIDDLSDFKSPNKSINVHGKASKKDGKANRIIFGIDNQNISPSNDEYLFTKTFRTLVNYSDLRNSQDVTFQNVYDKEISVIKFFGHSLGEADYSYFQQLFDFYNIYHNNNIKLIFYFKK